MQTHTPTQLTDLDLFDASDVPHAQPPVLTAPTTNTHTHTHKQFSSVAFRVHTSSHIMVLATFCGVSGAKQLKHRTAKRASKLDGPHLHDAKISIREGDHWTCALDLQRSARTRRLQAQRRVATDEAQRKRRDTGLGLWVRVQGAHRTPQDPCASRTHLRDLILMARERKELGREVAQVPERNCLPAPHTPLVSGVYLHRKDTLSGSVPACSAPFPSHTHTQRPAPCLRSP